MQNELAVNLFGYLIYFTPLFYSVNNEHSCLSHSGLYIHVILIIICLPANTYYYHKIYKKR